MSMYTGMDEGMLCCAALYLYLNGNGMQSKEGPRFGFGCVGFVVFGPRGLDGSRQSRQKKKCKTL